MKLKDLKPHSSKLSIRHPITGSVLKTDAGTDVVINVQGRDSQKFYDHQRKQLKLIAKEGPDKVTPDELSQLVVEQLAVCIIGWSKSVNPFFAGIDTPKGKGAYSHRLCVKLMEDGELAWLRDQLDDFLEDRANFFKG